MSYPFQLFPLHNFNPHKTKNASHQKTYKMKYTIQQQENIRSEVITQIQKDIAMDYYTAIYKLLSFVPTENLVEYLSATGVDILHLKTH